MRDILYIESCERILVIILVITSLYYYYQIVRYSNYYSNYHVILLSLLLLLHFIKNSVFNLLNCLNNISYNSNLLKIRK